jgi:hypothetical protein
MFIENAALAFTQKSYQAENSNLFFHTVLTKGG